MRSPTRKRPRFGEITKCIVCWCNDCKAMRVKVNNTTVNLVHDDTIVNLCDTYEVENTQRGEKVMILDPGAPVSLAWRPWLSKYLAEFGCKIKDIVSLCCPQVFKLGEIDKSHKSKLMIKLLLVVRSTKGKDDVLKAQVYVIEAEVTLLVGKKMLENWGSRLDTRKRILETCIKGDQKVLKWSQQIRK